MIELSERLLVRAEQIIQRVVIDHAVDKATAPVHELALAAVTKPHTALIFMSPEKTLNELCRHDSSVESTILDWYVELRTSCFHSSEEWDVWVEHVVSAVKPMAFVGSVLSEELRRLCSDSVAIKQNINANPWLIVPFVFSQLSVATLAVRKG